MPLPAVHKDRYSWGYFSIFFVTEIAYYAIPWWLCESFQIKDSLIRKLDEIFGEFV